MIEKTIKTLVESGLIPFSGAFEITETLLFEYINAYKKLSSGSTLKTRSNTKFSRKLAGLNLLKENKARGVRPTEILAGHIYLIGNPAFPAHYKVGASYDCYARLAQYQTYSPYRDFFIKKYDFVLDKFLTEKIILKHPLITPELGEWVLKENAELIFDDLSKENLAKYTGCW